MSFFKHEINFDKHILLAHKTVSGVELLFFINLKDNVVFNVIKKYIGAIADKLATHNVIRTFSSLEIHFVISEEWSKGSIQGINHAYELRANNNRRGFVFYDDVKSVKNRMVVYPDKQFLDARNNSSNDSETVVKFIRLIIGLIVHEATHLWHLRLNDIKEVIDRNNQRILDVSDEIYKDEGLIFKHEQGMKEVDSGADWAATWFLLRKELLMIMNYVVTEGIARFLESFETENDLLSVEGVKKRYGLAYQKAVKLNKSFGSFYKDFIQTIKKGFQVHFSLSAKEREDNLSVLINRLNDLMKTIKTQRKAGYVIGVHVYETILYANKGKLYVNILARYSYPKLIKEYESACEKLGFRPVITLDGEGVFSYRRHVRMLRRLRKETDSFL